MLAFTPLLFMPEGAGSFIRSLPAAVLYTVAASLFVSLTIIPFLASRCCSEHEHPEGNWLLRVVMRASTASIGRCCTWRSARPV